MNLSEANKKLSARLAGELVSDKPTEQITWTLYQMIQTMSSLLKDLTAELI